jgi:hypothetical protein
MLLKENSLSRIQRIEHEGTQIIAKDREWFLPLRQIRGQAAIILTLNNTFRLPINVIADHLSPLFTQPVYYPGF